MQQELPLNLPAARPLLPLEVVMVLLDCRSDDVVRDCESHVLPFAWNIASPNADRRELRIWRDSLLNIIAGRRHERFTIEEVINRILPGRGLRGREIERTFSCSQELVRDLDEAGLLVVERERTAATGVNAARLYTRDSIAELLRTRTLGATHLRSSALICG